MRQIIESQLQFGEVDISQIKPDFKSRDAIDKAVIGLQYIYMNPEIREKIFQLLEKIIPSNISQKTGRPGMELWKILVLGIMRQLCHWDYDVLQNMANNHNLLRQLLGHNPEHGWEKGYYYELQTLKDNVPMLTPEILKEINEMVVKSGHKKFSSKKKDELRCSADSFVVKTDIHFPSDISLLYDSIRKAIMLTKALCESMEKAGWRQGKHNIRTVKNEMRKIQRAKHGGKSKSEEKMKAFHQEYILNASKLLCRVRETITEMIEDSKINMIEVVHLMEIEKYVKYGEQQIDLINRRVLCGEKIPGVEKIFSVFEPYTRWISKGKSGVPVEFGLPVTILKDQYGYILDYEIMEKENDVDVAVPLTARAKAKYPAIKSCSFDKGYWSPENREQMYELIDIAVMPKKGRRNKAQQAEESSKEFKTLRKQHSAVESSINGLNHCGLDKCYDHGIYGFKRCVGLSILARNIHTLGNQIKEQENKRKRRKIHKKAA